ncbi:electron transport complex subunit RsxC [Candidatus Accumulibacter sp. ACC003]|uniref:electron transport complex subunit RsxC n=1 Tax=Candidatus Accumulibacter sp. ACC003 TaxID=2823334 RepID=UPI0025C2ECE7|nr:electron transport complex subunit RsxC [Candidatus Accumulibacter sp. ACC003]
MLQRLFHFKGGVKPQTHKAPSVQQPIGQAPLPARLYVPLHQSIGGVPNPLVEVGEHVAKGQLIGGADGWLSAAVHASTSGTVLAIEEHLAAHPSGLPTLTVVIEPDGRDEWLARTPVDYRALPPERVRELLRDAGVVGLGGAVFPSHAKLTAAAAVPVDELVINGAECEPYMSCDDMLMRERGEEIVRGIAIFRDLLAARRVLIGIEDNKPEAVAAMQQAVQRLGDDYRVVAVPTRYPAGGAKQLIRVLTGKEVPASKRSTDLGVQCFNVATAYTAWRALACGEPVISRIVTLAGNLEQPRNWEVRLGTPLRDLLALGKPKADSSRYLMGGPMMGFEIPSLDAPVVKATNCVIAASPTMFPPNPPEMPCIRCGACADVCPHELQPFELYWFARARNFGKTQEYHIFDCIECGCCSYVCPSHIPLVQYFRFAKSEIWSREREKNAADAAKARFELRNAREERELAEKAERLARAAAARAAEKKVASVAEVTTAAAAEATPATAATTTTEPAAAAPTVDRAALATAPEPPLVAPAADAQALKKATIVAAMERARAQREAVQPKNTEQFSAEQKRQLAAVEVRRAALQAEQAVSPATATPERSAD